jgi:hypothetical protein
MTTYSNDNPQRKAGDPKRTNSPVMWTMGAAFLIALLAVLFIYNGSDMYPKSGENPPPKSMISGSVQK